MLLKKNKFGIVVVLSLVLFFVFVPLYKKTEDKTAETLQQQTTNVKFKKGEQLYSVNCIACHDAKMTETATAPPLGGITKKRDLKWLYNYTKNPNAPQFKKNPIVAQIRSNSWGLMTAFPKLTNEDLDAIYYYIEERYQMTLKGIPVDR